MRLFDLYLKVTSCLFNRWTDMVFKVIFYNYFGGENLYPPKRNYPWKKIFFYKTKIKSWRALGAWPLVNWYQKKVNIWHTDMSSLQRRCASKKIMPRKGLLCLCAYFNNKIQKRKINFSQFLFYLLFLFVFDKLWIFRNSYLNVGGVCPVRSCKRLMMITKNIPFVD